MGDQEEESKEIDDTIIERIQDENENPSIQSKRPQLRMNANSGMAGAVYSPKTSTAKSKSMKKASSSLQHAYQSHQQPISGLSQHNSNTPGQQILNNNETETEKLLQSNDKVTVKELWTGAPKPDFPSFFLERLDLDILLTETT